MLNKYYFTKHAQYKMRFYRISEQMVKSVIARPKRSKEGIAPKTIVYMKTAGSKTKPHEIWVMTAKNKKEDKDKFKQFSFVNIVSAWRYPGVTKPGKPLPVEILNEMQELE